MKKQITIIRRKKKYDAVRAMTDLVERGFEVVYPLTEQTSLSKAFTYDAENKAKFAAHNTNSVWVCKLVREVQQ